LHVHLWPWPLRAHGHRDQRGGRLEDGLRPRAHRWLDAPRLAAPGRARAGSARLGRSRDAAAGRSDRRVLVSFQLARRGEVGILGAGQRQPDRVLRRRGAEPCATGDAQPTRLRIGPPPRASAWSQAMRLDQANVVLRPRSPSSVADLSIRYVFDLAPRWITRLAAGVLLPGWLG